MLIRQELKAVIEAILFVRAEAVSVEEIARITGASKGDVLTILTELTLEYNERKSGIEIVSSDAGFLMCTRPEYYEYVRESGATQAARLSQGVLRPWRSSLTASLLPGPRWKRYAGSERTGPCNRCRSGV